VRFLFKPVSQSRLLEALIRTVKGLGDREQRVCTPPIVTAATTPLRVLLAEDVPENQELVIELLRKWGYSVAVASNGRQAVEMFESEAFDLVLMDIQMPDMGGMEALDLIREKEKSTGGHTPVIALTAHAMKGDRERYLKAGMDGYVSKPIRAEELLQTIQRTVLSSPSL
jgi:CheY-like chemotaxis protein